MGLYGRTYMSQEFGRRRLPLGLSGPSKATAILILLNVAVFLAPALSSKDDIKRWIHQWLAVEPAYWWQVWRYVTFQFVHANWLHLLMNMMGLYFLGRPVEWEWGHRRYAIFYLACGMVGGLIHTMVAASLGHMYASVIGASGGVYGIVVACAIMYPQMRVILLVIPMTMRTLALVFLGLSVLSLSWSISSGNLGAVSDAAHLGGAFAAWVWLWVWPRLRPAGRQDVQEGKWAKKLEAQREKQKELDRILDKVKHQGLGALSWWEKRALRQATEEQRKHDKEQEKFL